MSVAEILTSFGALLLPEFVFGTLAPVLLQPNTHATSKAIASNERRHEF
jgi:hypothetical protein